MSSLASYQRNHQQLFPIQRNLRLVLQSRSATQPHPLREATSTNDIVNNEDMANFARSLKSPYLSPRLRPSMPSRTLSSSSDVSLLSHSPLSEDVADLNTSGRSTPVFPGDHNARKDGVCHADGAHRDEHRNVASPTSSRPNTPRRHSSRSRPIAIELPSIKRLNATSIRTPLEPLSARGDLPGGYFPLHEDPGARVHRPHPFQAHKESKMARHQSASLASDSRMPHIDRQALNPPPGLSITHANTPVASYIPAGFHDNPLPMGKYYPSNYEQRNGSQSSLRSSLPGSLSSSFQSDSQATPRSPDIPQISTPESEVQRRLQQYQRDMVAQASMAANELLASPSGSSTKLRTSISLSSIHIREGKFKPPAPLKPMSPRLLPLGSPGPVTPMSLESSAGGYMALGGAGALRRDQINSPGDL